MNKAIENNILTVSTHSRLKAAGAIGAIPRVHETVSTHSRLKAAGTRPKIL